ncbi:hypothetical protein [Rothia sp. P4278]|uniref:hypothetical protein n=1 Tax=Rothia sp. P4278 TaxID=3402658 RepID=UPI003ADCB02F
MKKETITATAAKTVEEVIDEKSFGNLSKLVPLVIIIFGAAITGVAFWVDGGTNAAAQEAIKTFGVVLGMAGAGSATAYLGRSQTQLDLQAARAANTVPVKTEDGEAVGALPADSGLIHGNYAGNREQEPKPVEEVTDPSFPVVAPEPVDESIKPGE